MAEDDWYGPFAGLLKNGYILVLVAGGVAHIIAGLIGYDMSRQSSGAQRWHGGPLWGDVLVGVCALAGGVYGYRRLRFQRRHSNTSVSD
jgi:hypothetical protein